MRQRSEHKPARLNFTTTRVLKQLFFKTFPAFEPWQRRHDRHRDMKRRNKLRLMPSSHHPTRRDATKTVLSSRVGWCELGSTRTRNKKTAGSWLDDYCIACWRTIIWQRSGPKQSRRIGRSTISAQDCNERRRRTIKDSIDVNIGTYTKRSVKGRSHRMRCRALVAPRVISPQHAHRLRLAKPTQIKNVLKTTNYTVQNRILKLAGP